jgi:hypothetical protein
MAYEDEDIGTRYYGTSIDDSMNYGYGDSGYGFDDPNNYGYGDSGYGFDAVNNNFDISGWDASEIQNTATTPGQEGYGWRYFTDGTAISPDGKYYSGGSLVYDPSNQSGFWGGVSNALGTKAANALKNKIMNPDGSINPAAIGTALAAIKMATGGNDVQTGGYNKPIPKLEAVREQVQYNDPSRAPGSTGRQYFTDTRYVPQGNAEALAAAKAASAEQASGLQAAAQPAPAPAPNPYAGKMNLAYAQQRPVPAPTQGAGLPQIPTQLNAQGGINMAEGGLADAGRYLQGKTDGMADEVPSSIDGEQPAALSHGEFVIPADVVSHLGNGNSDAGAQKLYEMMDRIRKARTGSTEQGKEINPDEFTMGGLAAAYAGGGSVQKFNTGNLVTGGATTATTATPSASSSGVIPYGTSASSQLSPWAGEYVTNYLGQGAAAAAAPYQAYTGPLTAGASDLQQQAFAGASEMAQAGYQPGQFTGSFTPQVAQQYMNPYLQASLDPQLKELNRQSQIARLEDAGRLTKAGAFGGSRQAIMESEGRRNLLDKQQDVLGQGYKTAYDLAQQQYAKERGDEEASRQFGANFGMRSIDQLSGLGAVQRGITSEGLAADKAQFEEQRDFMYKMPQYQKDLLQGIPVTTTATTSNTTELGRIGSGLADLQKLYANLANLGQTPAAPAPKAP